MVQASPTLIRSLRRFALVILGILVTAALCLYMSLVVFFISSAFLPLPKVLHHTYLVEICMPDASNAHEIRKPDGTYAPDVLITAHDNPDLIKSLKASAMVSSQPIGRPDFTIYINVDTYEEAHYRYDYFLATGEMGQGKEWCRVPPKFQAWMRTLRVGTSSGSPKASTSGGTEPVIVSAPRPKAK